jgi:ribosomal protein S1
MQTESKVKYTYRHRLNKKQPTAIEKMGTVISIDNDTATVQFDGDPTISIIPVTELELL